MRFYFRRKQLRICYLCLNLFSAFSLPHINPPSSPLQNEKLTTLNMPLWMVFGSLGNVKPSMQKVVINGINNLVRAMKLELTEEKSVKDILWGADSQVLSVLRKMPTMKDVMGKHEVRDLREISEKTARQYDMLRKFMN